MPTLHEISGTLEGYVYLPAIAAATATADFGAWVCPMRAKVTAINLVPIDAATGDDTNSATFTVKNGANTVASLALVTGVDLVAKTKKAFTLSATAAYLNLASGDVLACGKTKVASGLAIGVGSVQIQYQAR